MRAASHEKKIPLKGDQGRGNQPLKKGGSTSQEQLADPSVVIP